MRARSALLLLSSLLASSCGAMTAPIDDIFDAAVRRMPEPEVCNGLDDDLNGIVDDGFRDEVGRYVQLANCGRCGVACPATLAHATGVACELIEGTPSCVATGCAPGFARSTTGACVPAFDRMCLPCADDGDCGDFAGAHCRDIGSESRCTVDCTLGCPTGYTCQGSACLPSGGSCSCMPGDTFHLACALHDPTGMLCPGSADCTDGSLSMCLAPPEICDHADNDCNGNIDDPYRDARGAYSLDVHNCGDCGVDCTTSGVGLTCGGDPFAPHCILDCPDTHDGIMPGDHVDANGIIADGCECVVGSLTDVPGPIRTSGQTLDTNCDGADGIVVESFYVAPGGDDTGPGSPTRPLATVAMALMRASATIGTMAPRTHVFIASGVYPESVTLPDEVKVHGGYRRDFLSLDPDGFLVEIRAPTTASAPGGAALQVLGAGATETSIEWLTVHGVDAAGAGAAAFGVYVRDPGAMLTLRDMRVEAGAGGSGMQGTNGPPSTTAPTGPRGGGVPRAATEDGSHLCMPTAPDNQVTGGDGGHSTCGSIDVSGGAGGTATCPHFMTMQQTGSSGASATGGFGGRGGDDSQAPITDTCIGASFCCGLADFTVWSGFQGPSPGGSGTSGATGTAGRGCADAFGHFESDTWVPDVATGGTAGTPGGGGGGGGAGGGAEFNWTPPTCEFADALGGGGGGGGAGGCGGGAGSAGTSGGPSIGIVVRYTSGVASIVPTIRGVTITSSDGGRGGDGGAGGDGALGQTGAPGGEIPRSARTTPSLAGGFPGGRGGKGGDGGPGGGGGGGCGGASVGVWVTGVASAPGSDAWRTANTFVSGAGGSSGAGGGGGAAAANGMAGGTDDVLVR